MDTRQHKPGITLVHSIKSINMKVPLAMPTICESDIALAIEVLRSGQLVQGKNVQSLEKQFALFFNIKQTTLVANGTASLHLALLAAGVGPGDEVIVPAFSFVATANVVEVVGAKPVFVDIDIDTLNIDAAQLEAAINPRVKAIIPVHEFGMPAPMDAIMAFAAKHHLTVIEDAACALGATFDGRFAGCIGDYGSFSMHPRKNITSGEGGLLIIRDPAKDELIRQLRNHGISTASGKPEFLSAGFNYRMTDFQAALLAGQLSRIKEIEEKRVSIASLYDRLLRHPLIRKPYQSVDRKKYKSVWQSYHVILDDRINRDEIISRLGAAGVGSNYGAQCIPALPYYSEKYSVDAKKVCPQAYKAYRQGLVLPLYDKMTPDDVNYVITNVQQIVNDIK